MFFIIIKIYNHTLILKYRNCDCITWKH